MGIFTSESCPSESLSGNLSARRSAPAPVQPRHRVCGGLRAWPPYVNRPFALMPRSSAMARRVRADRAAEEVRAQREVLEAPDEHPAEARIGLVGLDVAGDHPGLVVHAPARDLPGRVAEVGLGAELRDHDLYLAREGARAGGRSQPSMFARSVCGRAAEALRVPALVVGRSDRVHRVVDVSRVRRVGACPTRRRRLWSPRVERPDQPRGAGTTCCRWPPPVPLNVDLVHEVPGQDARVRPGVKDVEPNAPQRALAPAARRARGPSGPARRTGSTPCHTRMPAASSRSSSAEADGRACWARVASPRCSRRRATAASMSAGVHRVAAARGRPPAARRRAAAGAGRSRYRRPSRQRHLARPDARDVAGFPRHREAQHVQLRAAGPPQVGARKTRARAC